MAIFNPLLSLFSADVVAVRDSASGQQLFNNARPMKCTVSESAQLMSHPIETGESVVDHRVILPNALSLSMVLRSRNYRATYQDIKQAFRISRELTVQTKADTYTGLYLRDIPHEENPEKFDTITIILELIEAITINVQTQDLTESNVINGADSSTVDRGEQATSDSGDRGTSLYRVFSR